MQYLHNNGLFPLEKSQHIASTISFRVQTSALYGHMMIEVSGTALIKRLVFLASENTCNKLCI